MASLVGKLITKRILKEKVGNNFGKEDPYFETVPATRLDGTPTGKVKKRKKALPPGVSDHDGKVLTKVKRRAWRLDMSLFSICGIRFGWGSAIAFIPAIGDALDALFALMVFRTCCQIEDGLPTSIKMKMMINIIFDFVLGLVPFVGDIADAAFRCNTKNAVLLEEHLREKGRKNLEKRGLPVPSVDPSDSEAFDRMARQEGQGSDDGSIVDRQPQSQTMGTSHGNGRHNGQSKGRTFNQDRPTNAPTVPPKAATRDNTRSSWFGFGGRQRRNDVEMGAPAVEPRR
ncbi:hypothetical protein SODALDRAFT_326934 [Sodiomyces alkalinus F11]|uniref:PH domain-containing protein n=1 Tax=Sodiomyces alkalinus (strain CBS 110278 / VKM F-3762 / F11) TaxID=1314773 RepID=A0A3N2Q7Y5_SODAK|nr:hypothetical protein SODALDRAFT_326934 [Sodiomyces alkalinus F11]ROT42778.1 hypothetical protein SODALDRAFT_326934 [Sodiomyces alkalinus F11]